jgi:Flp pilus assembly protein TadG
MSRRTRCDERGQALVELALALPVFLVMLLGIFSLGLGVYRWNGLAEAAREIARTTSVYHTDGTTLGASTETRRTVGVQMALVPGMVDPPPANFVCVDISGTPNLKPRCTSGDYVQVTVTAVFYPVAILEMGGPITMTSVSSIQIP